MSSVKQTAKRSVLADTKRDVLYYKTLELQRKAESHFLSITVTETTLIVTRLFHS